MAFVPPASGGIRSRPDSPWESHTQQKGRRSWCQCKTRGYSPWYLPFFPHKESWELLGIQHKQILILRAACLGILPAMNPPRKTYLCFRKWKKIKCKSSFPGVLLSLPEDGVLPRSMGTQHKEGAQPHKKHWWDARASEWLWVSQGPPKVFALARPFLLVPGPYLPLKIAQSLPKVSALGSGSLWGCRQSWRGTFTVLSIFPLPCCNKQSCLSTPAK